MQASLLVCLLAASVFGGQCRSSAESAPSPAQVYWWNWLNIAKRRGGIGERTSFGFGDGNGLLLLLQAKSLTTIERSGGRGEDDQAIN